MTKRILARELKIGDIIYMNNFWIKNRIVNRITFDDTKEVLYTQLITKNNVKEHVVFPFHIHLDIVIPLVVTTPV